MTKTVRICIDIVGAGWLFCCLNGLVLEGGNMKESAPASFMLKIFAFVVIATIVSLSGI